MHSKLAEEIHKMVVANWSNPDISTYESIQAIDDMLNSSWQLTPRQQVALTILPLLWNQYKSGPELLDTPIIPLAYEWADKFLTYDKV